MADPFRSFFQAHALELMDRARCSRRDKAELVAIGRSIIDCCRKARQEGLLALDEILDKLDPQLGGAVLMVVEGWDPEVWAETLVIQMLADAPRGKTLFKGLLILLGAADIHSGMNPMVVELRMRSLFGRDANLFDPPKSQIKPADPVTYADELAKVLARAMTTEQGNQLNERLTGLDDVEVQRMLREFDEHSWAYALGPTGTAAAWTRILTNLSARAARRLLETVLTFPLPTASIRDERQERMLRYIATQVRK